MAEITGGQLNYSVTVDVDQLKKGMSDAEGNIQGFTEVAEKAGASIDNAFSKSGSKVKDFTGIVRENVSIQKQVIKELESQIKEVQNRASGMAPGIGQATILNEAKALEKELAGEKAALADLELAMGKTATTSTTLGTKLAEAKNRLAELNLAAKEGKQVTAEQFREAEAEVKKYGEAIFDTNARTKALTAGTIGSLAQGLSLVTGTMAMGTSLMGAFGGKSEELNQIMIKTQALLAATVTLQEIKNTTVQQGGVISGIMAVQELARARATNLAAAGTLRATIAQRALNMVANANPYVLLATAIITVVGALALYATASSKAAKTTADLNNKMADGAAEPIIAYKKLQAQWNALGNDLKSKEKFIKDNQDAFKRLGVSVNDVSDAENIFVKNSSAMVAAIMMRARAAAAMELATEEYKKGLQKQLENEENERILKNGTTLQKMRVRSNQNVSLLQGESLDGRDNINRANNLVNRSVGYTKAEQDFIIKNGIKPWEEIEKIKKKKIKPVEPEEVFPAGSVAEIQKRIAAIDEALSKATRPGQIEALKEKRIAAAEELSEALKKIEIKSLEERSAEQEKFSQAYSIIAELQGKDAADKMYAPLMEGAQSYYGWLTNEQDKLIQKGGLLSETDKQNLVFLTQKINEIDGKKNAFQNFTDGIDEALAKIPTLTAQLEFLRNKAEEQLSLKGNKSFDDGEQKYLKEQQDKLLEQQKAKFKDILKEQESFEKKSLALQAEYDSMRALAKTDAEKKAVDQEYSKRATDLFFEEMAKSEEWIKVFTDMNLVATTKLEEFKRILQTKLSEAKTIEEKIKIGEFIKKIDDTISQRNPYAAIERAIKSMGDEALSAEEKLELLSKGIAAANGYLSIMEGIINDVEQSFDILGVSSDNAMSDVLTGIKETIAGIKEAMQGFEDLKESQKSYLEAKDAGDTFGQVMSGLGMVGSAVKIIGGAIKAISGWLSGDKKKEREIKKQAAALKELERVYNDLGRAIEKSLGDKFFDASSAAINNLKQQKALLEQMIRTEQSKKKADQDKINGYKDQINSINNAIEDMQQSMIDKVLNGLNAKGLADKLSDALTTAFQNGEDAAEAMGKTVDDILRDMVKNALKMKILEPAMQAVVDKMLASMGYSVGANGITGTFDGLTESEREELKNMMNQAGTNYMDALGAYTDLFGSQAGNAQGLKGDIKGITEKTAGALEAQINAIRILLADMHNINKNNQQTFISILQTLVMIEANTRNLIQIRQDISEMNSKIKKGLAGI